MMRLRPVWTTNLAATLIGFGMFASFVLVPEFVEMPRSTGYGFGASVTQAGLFLLPLTAAMLLSGPIAGRLSSSLGSQLPLALGALLTSLGFVVLAVLTVLVADRNRKANSAPPTELLPMLRSA